MVLEFKAGRKLKKVRQGDSPTTMSEIRAFCEANGFSSRVVRRVYEDGGDYKKYDYQWEDLDGHYHYLGSKLWCFTFQNIYQAWKNWGGGKENRLETCGVSTGDSYPIW